MARIAAGMQEALYLGNLEARRDWGYAPDYVEAMWRILQHDRGDHFVVATGDSHTVREFCESAFARVGLDWERATYASILDTNARARWTTFWATLPRPRRCRGGSHT